jgi:hypothetical protein
MLSSKKTFWPGPLRVSVFPPIGQVNAFRARNGGSLSIVTPVPQQGPARQRDEVRTRTKLEAGFGAEPLRPATPRFCHNSRRIVASAEPIAADPPDRRQTIAESAAQSWTRLALEGRNAKSGPRLLGGNEVNAAPDLDVDLSGLDPDEWTRRIDEIGEDEGYYQKIGDQHAALFIDAGPNLLVSFENRATAMSNPFGRPRGFDMATRENWSLLTILSDGDTWFRAPEIYGYFDRLVDEAFLEDFDKVLFFGIHDAGYAAAAYSVTAPGASALLIRPVATLDPSIAPWERRFLSKRRLDFTTRYGYAPDMVEALDRAHVIYDPTKAADAMHAALYRGPNVTFYPTRQARPRIEALFDGIGVTVPLLMAAMDGTLDKARFAELWRERRTSASYVRNLLKRVETDERPGLAARVCAFGLTTPDAEFYEDRITTLHGTVATKTPA